jgi:hypothetical protein
MHQKTKMANSQQPGRRKVPHMLDRTNSHYHHTKVAGHQKSLKVNPELLFLLFFVDNSIPRRGSPKRLA